MTSTPQLVQPEEQKKKNSQRTPSARRRRERMAKLVQMKQIEHLTNAQAARKLGICDRSVYNLLSSEEYTAVVEEMRNDWREAAITETHSLASEALATMREIMATSRSDIARYNAAAKVGDWVGLQRMAEDQGGDDRQEMERLVRIREEQAAHLGAQSATEGIAAYISLLQPGGFLPSEHMSDTGHMLMSRAEEERAGAIMTRDALGDEINAAIDGKYQVLVDEIR